MEITTGRINKHDGRDAALGAPVQVTLAGIQPESSTSLMGATVINVEDATAADPMVFTTDDFDQPLHCRPIRFAWSATAGTVRAVIAKITGKDAWRNPLAPVVKRLTAEGTVDTDPSIRFIGQVQVVVEGDAGSTVTVSLGDGLGIGSPTPFLDDRTTIGTGADGVDGDNLDIQAVRDPADDTAIAVSSLKPNPSNTILFAAQPTDLKIEMQTRFGDPNASRRSG